MNKCRKDCDTKVKALVEGFKRDMKIIDTEVTKERSSLQKECKDLKMKLEATMLENVQIK